MEKKYEKKCIYCFGKLGKNGKCLTCHKKQDLSTASENHLAPHTMLKDRYIIGRVLGAGGFGISYSAWDTLLKQQIAIKEYFPTSFFMRTSDSTNALLKKPEFKTNIIKGLKFFTEEAKTMIRLKKLSGIVSVLDFFSENNTAYIVMEYLDGLTLKQFIKKKGKLPFEETISLHCTVIESHISVAIS